MQLVQWSVHECVRAPPLHMRELQSTAAGERAHHLRVYASTLRPVDQFDEELYKPLVGYVLVLGRVSNYLDSSAASRLAQELRHHAFLRPRHHLLPRHLIIVLAILVTHKHGVVVGVIYFLSYIGIYLVLIVYPHVLVK